MIDRPIGRRELGKRMALALGTIAMSPALATGLAQAEETRRIDHALATTEITGKPLRIVALEFSFVQALDSLDVVPVGISDDNQPKRIEQLLGKAIDYASVGTRLEPNLELVGATMPDLIIADQVRHSAIYSQLSAIAPTIVLNSWEGDYRTIKTSLVTIADAMGEKDRGERVIANHDAAMAAIVAKIPRDEKRRFLLAVSTADSMSLHTSSSFSGSVFEAIGLQPAIVSTDPVESGAGLERLIAINPDVLFVATDGGGTVIDRWKTNSAFQNLAAAKAAKIFEVDRNQFARFRGLKTAGLIASDIVEKVYS